MMKAYEQERMMAEVEGMFRPVDGFRVAVAHNGVAVAVVLTLCRDASNMVIGVFSLFLLQLTGKVELYYCYCQMHA